MVERDRKKEEREKERLVAVDLVALLV